MTVESNPFPLRYSGDGTTTVFPVTAYFLNEEDVGGAHLRVTKRSSSGTETILTENTHYTVTGAGNPAGGSITMLTAPATGETLVINRNVPRTQRTDYQSNDPFPAETHERGLDKLTMMLQQNDAELARTIVFPETDPTTITRTLPTSTARANKALVFDASGNVTISTNDYNDTDAQDALLAQTEAARDAALGYAQDAAEILDQVEAASFIAASSTAERFSGNGVTTAFTLSVAPFNEENTSVYISGVYQQKDTYSISGTTLTFSSAPPSGTDNIEVNIMKGYAIGTPTDGTVTTSSIVDGSVTFAKMQDISTDRLLGRESSGSGDIEQISLGTGLELSSGTLQFTTGGIPAAAIADDSVTFAKMQNIGTSKLLGRFSAGTGDVQEITIGAGLAVTGGALVAAGSGAGDMLAATYDPANIAQQVVGTTAVQTLTNKTLTSAVLNTGVSGTAISTNTSLSDNSDTLIASQRAVKSYVDTGLAGKANTSHTHTASAITDFQETVEDVIGSAITAGTNITVSYNDTTGKTTINASGGGGGGWTDAGDYIANSNAVNSTKEVRVYDDSGIAALLPSKGSAMSFLGDSADRNLNYNQNHLWQPRGYQGYFHATRQATDFTETPTDYVFLPQMASVLGNLVTYAGYQQNFNSDSGGRTYQAVFHARARHHGKGDVNLYGGTMSVMGHDNMAAISGTWTGQPSGVVVAGDVWANADKTNLYGQEFQLYSNAKANTTAIGSVIGLYRDNNTAEFNHAWIANRAQSDGSVYADVAYQVAGKFEYGFDATGMTMDANKAVIVMPQGGRIYANCAATSWPVISGPTSLGNAWYDYESGHRFFDSGNQVFQAANGTCFFSPGGTSRFQVDSSQTIVGTSNLYVRPDGVNGSTVLRVQNSVITCNQRVDIASSSIINYRGGLYTSTAGGLHGYITVQIDGVNKKMPVYHMA